ncbi:hypothetical protein [Saprospira grandis]|nr:hypothetical protein [Saprospira grandis]
MPLDWRKGDQKIVPPPKILEQMDARLADDSCEKIAINVVIV